MRNPWAEAVNDALRTLPQRVKQTTCAEAAGLEHKGDNLHFDGVSARELGRRYAKAMTELIDEGGNP